MDELDKKLRQMAAEEKFEMPEAVKQKMEDVLAILPPKKAKSWAHRTWMNVAAAAACLVCVLLFVMPNVSTAYAEAMADVPVLGGLIRVFTIRNYFYSDPHHEMDIDVPSVSDPRDSDAASEINKDVDELTSHLMEQFYQELEAVGDSGHGSIYVDYDVLMNTDRWFTLKLAVNSVSGSGDVYYRFYNVDRATGKIVSLADLFNTPKYAEIIKADILEQMKQRMEGESGNVYWISETGLGSDSWQVTDHHSFYFNKDGELVIPFDKYEVAPGSMGNPEFIIHSDAIESILKPEYGNVVA